MKRALWALLLVAACDGNPFVPEEENPLPPGPTDPTARDAIRRTETAEDDSGNGYAGGFRYDAATDTFRVTGLPFDGDADEGIYTREDRVGSLGPYAVYEGPTTNADGNFAQFAHRAIYGVDPDGDVAFGIVRTGDYREYGFGGWFYERNGRVVLPTVSGQRRYTGDYAALRDFEGAGGLEYATGDMEMVIDFDAFTTGDFENRNAVYGEVSNRRILDINGRDITASVLGALNADRGTSLTELPVLLFEIGPNVMTSAGEISGNVSNSVAGDLFESGHYYAVVSGRDAGEVVGIIVVEADDPRFSDVGVRETGGFILVHDLTTRGSRRAARN